MLIIKNRDEIIEQLTKMLIQFDKDMNGYQTDVYLYYDEEKQTATLDTFVNVGGNSWLNDDHYTIYCDKEHYETVWDWFNNVQELAESSEISLDQLRTEAMAYLEIDKADYELTYDDAREYLETKDEYMDKLKSAYFDGLDEMQADYISKAELLLEEMDNKKK